MNSLSARKLNVKSAQGQMIHDLLFIHHSFHGKAVFIDLLTGNLILILVVHFLREGF